MLFTFIDKKTHDFKYILICVIVSVSVGEKTVCEFVRKGGSTDVEMYTHECRCQRSSLGVILGSCPPVVF